MIQTNGFFSPSHIHVNTIKKDHLAVAVLLDVAYHSNRYTSELKKDLKLNDKECAILKKLNEAGYLRPNPHPNVKDVKYVLAPKGYFLVNELKAENPSLLKDIEPKLIPLDINS